MQQEQPTLEIIDAEHSEPFSPSIMKLAQTYELGQPQQEYLASFPLDPRGKATGLTIAVWLCTVLLVFFEVFLLGPYLLAYHLDRDGTIAYAPHLGYGFLTTVSPQKDALSTRLCLHLRSIMPEVNYD